MAERTHTILLRGGPGDGSTLAQVPENAPQVNYQGTLYMRTTDEAPRPGDPGAVGPDSRVVVQLFPVYSAEPSSK